MDKEAILNTEDVSLEEQGGNNERLNALEAIAARHDAEENREEAVPPEEKPEETEEEPEAAESAPEPEPEYEIKVDGEIQKVPLSKLLDAGKRTLQKETAADKRLEEAAKKAKELEERERYIQWTASQQAAAPKKDPREAWQERVNSWREAIQYGDADQANKAIVELIAAGAQMATPQIHAVEAKLAAERHNEAIRAKFQTDFQDVASDPELYQLASAMVDHKRSQGDTRNDWEFYEEIGSFVRGLKSKFAPEAKAVAVNIEARQEKKRAAEQVPTMGGRTQAPQEDKEPTRQDIINEMRRVRAG